MKRTWVAAIASLLLITSMNAQNPSGSTTLKSRAETSNYEETSRYDDVIGFVNALQKHSDLVRVETFGHTEEKRAMPLLILSNPPVSDPRAAEASGKPVVFVMANIHAGEVEGKEAVQRLARRMIDGDLRPLLDKLVILIAPDYNADGNEKVALTNRTAQNGPIGGVGTRENANGLDLNRDYMKLDSAEAKALVRLLARWDPHLTIDLHTTNGSYHGYHLTYSPSLNPNTDARLIAFERDKMLPAVTQSVLKDHKFRTYYYGNFSTKESLNRELNTPTAEGTKVWRTFDHRPRFGNNYIGLRNRLTILSEAYSYLPFKGRVDVTEAFVEDILKYSAAHASEIVQLIKAVDRETAARGSSANPGQAGVAFEVRALPQPVDILVGEVEKIKNPRSGHDMTAITDKDTPTRMPDYGIFAATRSNPIPHANVFRREAVMEAVLANLRTHGITVEELTEPASLEVDAFAIDVVTKADRPFQNHAEVSLKGQMRQGDHQLPCRIDSRFDRTAAFHARLLPARTRKRGRPDGLECSR